MSFNRPQSAITAVGGKAQRNLDARAAIAFDSAVA